jgi:hypothetical protein
MHGSEPRQVLPLRTCAGVANPSTCPIESSDELIKTHRQCVQMPEALFSRLVSARMGYTAAPGPEMDPSTAFMWWLF